MTEREISDNIGPLVQAIAELEDKAETRLRAAELRLAYHYMMEAWGLLEQKPVELFVQEIEQRPDIKQRPSQG